MIRSMTWRSALVAMALGLAPAASAFAQGSQPARNDAAPGTQMPPAMQPPEMPGGQGSPTEGQGAATGTSRPGAASQGGGTAPVPAAGANSFTAEQARARIADAGFADVADLRLDERGVWHAQAMRGGQRLRVALDYQGNVIEMR